MCNMQDSNLIWSYQGVCSQNTGQKEVNRKMILNEDQFIAQVGPFAVYLYAVR